MTEGVIDWSWTSTIPAASHNKLGSEFVRSAFSEEPGVFVILTASTGLVEVCGEKSFMTASIPPVVAAFSTVTWWNVSAA
jgi:hypothetical protein